MIEVGDKVTIKDIEDLNKMKESTPGLVDSMLKYAGKTLEIKEIFLFRRGKKVYYELKNGNKWRWDQCMFKPKNRIKIT